MDFGIVIIILVSLYLGVCNGVKNIKCSRAGLYPASKKYNNLFEFIFNI